MNTFYDILDILYKINHEIPEISFGKLMHTLVLSSENIFYMSDAEILKRLQEIIKEDE